MRTLLFSLVLMPLSIGCDTKDDTGATMTDADADADADADGHVSDAVGCDQSGVACLALVGPGWAGQEEANCQANSDASVDAGGGAYELAPDGCPDGALSVCTGLYGADQDGNVIDAAEYYVYFYGMAAPDQAEASCDEGGGSFSTL